MSKKKKYHFKPGDVIRFVEGSSYSERWFGTRGPFLVDNYPSKFKDWEDQDTRDGYVDIVNLDGSPPNYTGECINACAMADECAMDIFLTAARKASGMGVPPCPVKRTRYGWPAGVVKKI